jgi:hypothetical protein
MQMNGGWCKGNRQQVKACHQSTVNCELFNYLKFAGLNHPAVFIKEVVEVKAPVKIVQIDGDALAEAFLLVYFFADEAGDLEGIALVVTTLQLKGYYRGGRVGVKFYQLCARIGTGGRFELSRRSKI